MNLITRITALAGLLVFASGILSIGYVSFAGATLLFRLGVQS